MTTLPLSTEELASRDPLLIHMPNVALALLLLLQRRDPQSFWKPYVNILPQKYTTVLYFSPDEMLHLKGSPAFGNSSQYMILTQLFSIFSFIISCDLNFNLSTEMALRQCRSIARQYAYFSKLFQVCLSNYFLSLNASKKRLFKCIVCIILPCLFVVLK